MIYCCLIYNKKKKLPLFDYILESLVCNDIQESRVKKIHNVMSEYISDYQNWGSRLMFTQINARHINEPDVYNKVII